MPSSDLTTDVWGALRPLNAQRVQVGDDAVSNLRNCETDALAQAWPAISADIRRITLTLDPPRNATVARIVGLRPSEATTVYSACWPEHLIRQAKQYGGDWSARRLGGNAWRVERIA